MTPVDEPNGQDAYDSEEEYDSEDDSEDEDGNKFIEDMAEEASEDELDEIDARIHELEEADAKTKSSKKRRASSEADLDTVLDEAAAAEPKVEKKLSKKERKKLKAANGEAVAAASPVQEAKASEEPQKSVSFTKETKPAAKKLAGGLSVDDRKVGEGPGAKKGAKITLRYVGKLTTGSIFDSNTSGAPFKFTIGSSDVIKGLDQGVLGIKIGGERRITIPAALAYGSKPFPGIPANSDLVFDVKCLSLK